MNVYFKQYLQYVINAGGPTIEQFDDDWEPIGPRLRKQLSDEGLIDESDHSVRLTALGKASLQNG